ncbi:hypothetical protein [Arthrobacter sp.]|uniref:hypothetical protein n=1 Tax=Arthrobacter sp. TaxID=1667 RepID=UPI0026DF89E7|nr:hypothetical protein [Arthrobacter sp.]MDO5752450.1 hypothetical protein [Arthrobacter sp.]
MKNRFFSLVTTAGVAVTVLVGCAQPAPAPAAQPLAATLTATATACGSCDGLPQADHTGVSDPGWDKRAKADALEVASKAMVLYNRPAVDGKRWIYDLAQYMTDDAGAKYQGVDPANLPAFTTMGPPKLVIDPANGFAANAQFATTVGVFDFELRRQGGNREWKIQYINMPDGFH